MLTTAIKSTDWTRLHLHKAVRLAWCLLGAGTGIGLALWLIGPPKVPFLLASLGGTTVFLFGLTRAPAGQPRAVLGGHLGGGLMGIACYQVLGDRLESYILAQMLGLGWMLLTRSVHPPAGANPIIMVHAHASWNVLLRPVLLGVTALLCVAWVWSRLYPGLQRYPVSVFEPSPAKVTWGGWDD